MPQRTHAYTCAYTETHALNPFYWSSVSVRCVSSEDDWSLKETSSNATFTAWADLLPFFIISASPHFPAFYFPVPLLCLFPCTQYYCSFSSGCVPNASKSGIISEHLRPLNNKEWAGLTFPVTLHCRDYLEKVAKIYLGAEFISVRSRILLKGLCPKQKSFPEKQLFLELSSRLTIDFILQAQLGVRLIMCNCRSIVDL